tara:strand:- start:59 stop:1084 length:1026 start_codon:yes stop_codon:yes gene_type:complete
VTSQRAEQENRHRSTQVLLALFSIIFIAVITYGYYHLLLSFGWFIAFVGGLLIASIAWYLARVAGTSPGGMKASWLLIIPLFVISAAGVYNSMMVFLEGEQVLADTASIAQNRFSGLESAANRQLTADGVVERKNKVNSLRDALISEIKNPLNCGQGPEARRLIAELKRALPEFEPLSGARNCEQNEAVINDYNERIDALISRAPWNNPELNVVVNQAGAARSELGKLRKEVSRSYSANDIAQISSIFEGFQTDYQDLLQRLGKEADIEDLPDGLDIVAAQSLGNVYRLPALVLNRLDEASTYVYLLVALGFDLLLVYLFQIANLSRARRPAIASPISGAW